MPAPDMLVLLLAALLAALLTALLAALLTALLTALLMPVMLVRRLSSPLLDSSVRPATTYKRGGGREVRGEE